MDFKKIVLGVAAVVLLPTGILMAKDQHKLVWDSGFDAFCEGACVSVYRTEAGATLYFTDPANSSTKFVREIRLPKGATISRPVLVNSIDAKGPIQKYQAAPSTKTSSTIPPPPQSGTGVITTSATLSNSRGSVYAVLIIQYYYVNGLLVNVVTDYIYLSDQGGVE